MQLHVDVHSPIPIRRQLTEQFKHVIEAGGFRHEQALPSIRQLAGLLDVNPNTVARVLEDLKRDGYVYARRGKGVFVAPHPPARPAPSLRDAFLKDVVIRGAALGMSADEVAVGVLSLARVRPAPLRQPASVLLVECSSEVLEFFANEIESHLPVHVDKVPLDTLSAAVRRRTRGHPWAAAVTSFFHLREVERRMGARRVPVIPLLANAHLATLHRLAQFPSGTRVGVVAADAETAHNLEYSIVSAGLPNIALAGACSVEAPSLASLVRHVEVIVCSTPAAERVHELANSQTQVITDDRALDMRAIEMLAAILIGQDDGKTLAVLHPATKRASHPKPTTRRPMRARRQVAPGGDV